MTTEALKTGTPKSALSAFIDFFILFSGISTASNLTRTQGRALLQRGIFLVRNQARNRAAK